MGVPCISYWFIIPTRYEKTTTRTTPVFRVIASRTGSLSENERTLKFGPFPWLVRGVGTWPPLCQKVFQISDMFRAIRGVWLSPYIGLRLPTPPYHAGHASRVSHRPTVQEQGTARRLRTGKANSSRPFAHLGTRAAYRRRGYTAKVRFPVRSGNSKYLPYVGDVLAYARVGCRHYPYFRGRRYTPHRLACWWPSVLRVGRREPWPTCSVTGTSSTLDRYTRKGKETQLQIAFALAVNAYLYVLTTLTNNNRKFLPPQRVDIPIVME